MNNLRFNVTVPSLSYLTPIGTNTYQVVVKFFNSLTGDPLNQTAYIPNSHTATVITASTTFNVDVPVTDGNWTVNNVNVKIYANNDSNCCIAQQTYPSIANTEDSTPDDSDLEVSYYSN